MSEFLKDILRLTISTFIIFLLLLMFGDWSSSTFYYKVAPKELDSMIIGGSRALQGIDPEILNKYLQRDDIFNYAFSNETSPYGALYFDSISKKLKKSSKKNIYLICVNPSTISSETKNPNDEKNFRELKTDLLVENYSNGLAGKMKFYFSRYRKGLINLIINDGISKTHKNGYLELNLKNDKTRLDRKISGMKKGISELNFSSIRFNYLDKTIRHLKNSGEVYLIRLPMHPKIHDLENQFMSDFNDVIRHLAKKNKIEYFDLTLFNGDYEYTDGTHLKYSSAQLVSEKISFYIMSR